MRSLLGAVLLLAGNALAQHYQQTNLVSNQANVATHMDANLVNAWGLSRSSTSPWWVSDNGQGLSTLYNGDGTARPLVVSVPGGAPSGTVFNGSPDFQIAPGQPALFLFVSEDGTISGWNSKVDATHAIAVVRNPNSVYKGAAIGIVNGQRRLYAADFHNARIDVFDANFKPLCTAGDSSEDDCFGFGGMPRGLAPFNIQNLGGTLFVTFAKQDDKQHDDVAGPGNGLVAAFNARGQMVRRFQHVPGLNSPWGLAMAPSDFGIFSHHLLVGQFGSGEILAFNLETGKFSGNLLDTQGNPLKIDGLWALGFGNDAAAGPANALFFTAGPNEESNGLFGTLVPLPTDLIQGNGL